MNALSRTDKGLSKWIWLLMEKKASGKWKDALKWKEGEGILFCAQFQKNKVCVWGEKKKGKEKKKEMGQNKPQKIEFSLEKLERNSSTPCALYMLTEGLLQTADSPSNVL